MFTFLLTGVCSAAISLEGEQLINDEYLDMLETVKKDTGAQDINFDNSFHNYSYDDVDLDLSKPFGEHLYDDNNLNYWLVPNGNQTREFVYVTELGKWVEYENRFFNTAFVDKDGKELNITCSLNGFMEFAENKFDGDIDELKITSRGFGNEYATYIYFTSNDAAYVIPLALQAEISCGLVSGEIYDAEVAKKMFDDTIVYSDDPVGGGTATDIAEPEILTQQNVADKAEKQETSSVDKKEDNLLPDSPENTNDYTVYIAIGVGVLVLAAAVVTLALLKKKR